MVELTAPLMAMHALDGIGILEVKLALGLAAGAAELLRLLHSCGTVTPVWELVLGIPK
jgi:hypothetical protein